MPDTSPAPSNPGRATRSSKSQRVLACIQCQRRKVKCDRKFPCANCLKASTECIPAATLGARPRRARFPEKILLDRIRRYEHLLRQHRIDFEALHSEPSSSSAGRKPQPVDDGSESPDEAYAATDEGRPPASSPRRNAKSDTTQRPKNLWHAMNQKSDSDEESSPSLISEVRETVLNEIWDHWQQNSDHLLFGMRNSAVDLSTLHPGQIQIIRLWQIYLDNVNPLLKVTHTSTLQGRMIEAAGNLSSIEPTLAALMFSIYCVAILSLDDSACQTNFGSPKETLLTGYQLGCQQALLECQFLRSSRHDCLVALYLYLISIRPSTDPHTLSSLLSLAIRIAQRMGLHDESTYAKCSIFEAQMRRRLWWSLILFDTRICEMADYRTTMLSPIWDCNLPIEISDFDLHPGMRELPTNIGKANEALFAVVRSEMANFVRYSAFHLDFLNPALKSMIPNTRKEANIPGNEVSQLENLVEERYLAFCNPDNPLHFMTVWTARGYIAKYRLIEHYSNAKLATSQTDAQRNTGISYALRMLECDTKLMTSPLVKGYLWLIQFQFPFPAYIHIFGDLRTRPSGDHADRAWEVMSANYQARFTPITKDDDPFSKLFAKIVLQAWEAREAAVSRVGEQPMIPQIVSDIKQRIGQDAQNERAVNTENAHDIWDMKLDDLSMSMTMESAPSTPLFGFSGSIAMPNMQRYNPHYGWPSRDWDPAFGPGWSL